jgi:glycosyltransferase involved in cell wall biosynthesis
MRILMLTDFYPPTVGGVERHVGMLSGYLADEGHRVAVCTVKQASAESYESRAGAEIYRIESLLLRMPFTHLDPAKRYHPPFADPGITAGLREIVEEFRPNLIHSHGWIVFSYLPLQKRYDIPIVTTLHNFSLICPRQDLLLENQGVCTSPLFQNCFRCSSSQYGVLKSAVVPLIVKRNRGILSTIDRFTAVSNFVRDVHMKYLNLAPERISRLPNFCDSRPENGSDIEESLPDDFMLYVGSLAPHKGIDVLLRAYKDADIDSSLVVLGTKHPSYGYTQFQRGNRIIIRENPPRELVVRALERCRFLVLPSICADACPTTVIEAMKYGKPVIASTVGGIPDLVVDGETGLLVPPGDARSLTEAIERLAGRKAECDEMGDEARNRFLRNFTLQKVVQDLIRIYSATLKSA